MRINTACFLTLLRIVFAAIMLIPTALSPAFFALYIAAGASDAADGAIARMTHTETSFGAALDTAADIVFTASALIKLLPVLHLPLFIFIWAGAVAAVKLTTLLFGALKMRTLVSVHSAANRLTGILLFMLPFSLRFADTAYSVGFICTCASFAAVQEFYFVTMKGLVIK